jgi:hypothetical protein
LRLNEPGAAGAHRLMIPPKTAENAAKPHNNSCNRLWVAARCKRQVKGTAVLGTGHSVDVSAAARRNAVIAGLLAAAPADNTGNAIDHYLGKWNEVLWEVYPDYVISGGNTLLGGAMAFDQTFILQQVIAGNDNISEHIKDFAA